MNITPIHQIVTADAHHTIHVTLPPDMSNQVEIIILPINQNQHISAENTPFSPFLERLAFARMQEQTGFAKNILGSSAEDVWNDL
ncbi:MAG: hypothetical protein Q8O31_00145 [Rhodocyclaceae bacterium]|nr:hypothetical protein [Rhodocyclaceae bacterium]